MKKKALTWLTALAIMTLGTATVFAESPTVGNTEKPVSTQTVTTTIAATSTPDEYLNATGVSEGYTVEAVSDTTVKAASVAVQNAILNDIAATGALVGNNNLKQAATDSTKKVTASILSVVEINSDTAVVDENGKYIVTLNIASIAANDTIVVLHYDGSEWETIVPSKVGAGSVTFTTSTLSPFSIVKLDVASVAASPKTGETVPTASVLIIIGLAGAVFCGKKYFV